MAVKGVLVVVERHGGLQREDDVRAGDGRGIDDRVGYAVLDDDGADFPLNAVYLHRAVVSGKAVFPDGVVVDLKLCVIPVLPALLEGAGLEVAVAVLLRDAPVAGEDVVRCILREGEGQIGRVLSRDGLQTHEVRRRRDLADHGALVRVHPGVPHGDGDGRLRARAVHDADHQFVVVAHPVGAAADGAVLRDDEPGGAGGLIEAVGLRAAPDVVRHGEGGDVPVPISGREAAVEAGVVREGQGRPRRGGEHILGGIEIGGRVGAVPRAVGLYAPGLPVHRAGEQAFVPAGQTVVRRFGGIDADLLAILPGARPEEGVIVDHAAVIKPESHAVRVSVGRALRPGEVDHFHAGLPHLGRDGSLRRGRHRRDDGAGVVRLAGGRIGPQGRAGQQRQRQHQGQRKGQKPGSHLFHCLFLHMMNVFYLISRERESLPQAIV